MDSGQAGSEIRLSRTYSQNGKRLAAYGDLSVREIQTQISWEISVMPRRLLFPPLGFILALFVRASIKLGAFGVELLDTSTTYDSQSRIISAIASKCRRPHAKSAVRPLYFDDALFQASAGSIVLHLQLLDFVFLLDAGASYDREPITAKQKRGARFIVSHPMSHVRDCGELSRSRSGDIDHLVVPSNCRDVPVGLARDEKTAHSQGSQPHPGLSPSGARETQVSWPCADRARLPFGCYESRRAQHSRRVDERNQRRLLLPKAYSQPA